MIDLRSAVSTWRRCRFQSPCFEAIKKAVPDPTTLILVDEADRLQMNSLETMRSIFDEGKTGTVLIGSPRIEKQVARFPQFYSRIGFVHEFRPLDKAQITQLLEQRWAPALVTLTDELLARYVVACLIRMSAGDFRLLSRLLTQIDRILKATCIGRDSIKSRIHW